MADSKQAMADTQQEPLPPLPLVAWYGRGDGDAETPLRDWFTLGAIAAASGMAEKAISKRLARRSSVDSPTMLWRPSGLHLKALKQRGMLRQTKAREALLLSRACIESVVPELDLRLLPSEGTKEDTAKPKGRCSTASAERGKPQAKARAHHDDSDDHDDDARPAKRSRSASASGGASASVSSNKDSLGEGEGNDDVEEDDDIGNGWDGGDDFGGADATTSENGVGVGDHDTREGVPAGGSSAFAPFARSHVYTTDTAWYPPLPPGSPPPLPPLPPGPPPPLPSSSSSSSSPRPIAVLAQAQAQRKPHTQRSAGAAKVPQAVPLTLAWKEAAIVALSRVYTPKPKQNNVQRVARALVRTGKAGKRSGTANTRCTNADLVALKVFHEVEAPVEGMLSAVMRAQIREMGDEVWVKEARVIKFVFDEAAAAVMASEGEGEGEGM